MHSVFLWESFDRGPPVRTVEELRQALLAFWETYNDTWLIERHGFLSPADYRRRQLQPLVQAV